jgi:hypothetical protein
MFVEEGMVRSRLEDFPYGRVSSVQSEKGMLFGKLIIFASGNKAEIKNVAPKDRATEIGDYVRTRIAESSQSSASPVAPTAASDDPYEALRKLGELRDVGVISLEEFEEKKAALLQRI